MKLTSAEHCAGYGGLARAIEAAFNSETRWFTEIDKGPSKILAYRWPDVPNHGDMTKIDWATVEPVDILGGGTPCQDLSHAGRRRGMTEGTRSNLWVQMRESIAIIRPTWVVWENVRGAYSACASSEMGQCPGCVDRRVSHRPFLRALGRILGDLSDLGYDCQWRGLRASDVGAPHARFRVFVLARRRSIADRDSTGHERPRSARNGWDGLTHISEPTAHTDNPGRGEQWRTITVQPEHSTAEYAGADAADASGARRAEGEDGGTGCCHAGPRPWGSEPERTGGERSGATTDTLRSGRGEGRAESTGQHRRSATTSDRASTPNTNSRDDAGRIGDAQRGTERGETTARAGEGTDWGDYGPAIRRWEAQLNRPSPRPTEPTGRDGSQRLSSKFCEWMMGLPDGWVTDPAIGLSRNEQLKACGNGVVPQQAYAAIMDMLKKYEENPRP